MLLLILAVFKQLRFFILFFNFNFILSFYSFLFLLFFSFSFSFSFFFLLFFLSLFKISNSNKIMKVIIEVGGDIEASDFLHVFSSLLFSPLSLSFSYLLSLFLFSLLSSLSSLSFYLAS